MTDTPLGELRQGPGMDLSGITRPCVRPVPVDPLGRDGPTPKAARGPAWRRTSRSLYVPAYVDGSALVQRVVEAAAVLPDDHAGVTGWAALAWQGGTWFDGSPWGGGATRPVPLAIGGWRRVREQPGFEVSEERLNPAELIVVDGLPITMPARSVCYEMRYAPSVRLAVVTLCMAAFSDLVSIDEVSAYAARLNGWTGIPRCREAIGFGNENSWSPPEISMALTWELDAGRPRPRCNVPVFDRAGRHLATPDLLDVEHGVAGEYDGAVHLHGAQRSRDVEREELLRSHGLEYVTMLAADNRDPTNFIRRLHSAYDRAAAIPASRWTWTIEQPAWWIDTSTVAARRALSELARERWLRHRAA